MTGCRGGFRHQRRGPRERFWGPLLIGVLAETKKRQRAGLVGAKSDQRRCLTHCHWNSPSYRTVAGKHSLVIRTTSHIGTLRPTARRAGPTFVVRYSSIGPRSTGAEADGAEGSRTPDLCSAIAALSQLSYSPESQTHAAPQSVRGRATYNGSFAPRCSQDEPSSMKVTVPRRGGEGRQFARRGGV